MSFNIYPLHTSIFEYSSFLTLSCTSQPYPYPKSHMENVITILKEWPLWYIKLDPKGEQKFQAIRPQQFEYEHYESFTYRPLDEFKCKINGKDSISILHARIVSYDRDNTSYLLL
jgi:hypothetical protein